MGKRSQLTNKKHIKKGSSTIIDKDIELSPFTSPATDRLLSLQRSRGNQAVQILLKGAGGLRLAAGGQIQARLIIGQPNDIHEQEACRVAEQVIRMPDSKIEQKPTNASRKPSCREEETIQTKRLNSKITSLVPRKTIEEKKKEKIRIRDFPGNTPEAISNMEDQINYIKGGGKTIPKSSRAFFEKRFGQDFSDVRIHNDSKASEIAQTLNAKAFTTGKNIVFGAGQYAPETSKGRKLMAHELTHIVQQSRISDMGESKISTSQLIQRSARVVDRENGVPHTIRFHMPTPDHYIALLGRIRRDLEATLHHRVAEEILTAMSDNATFSDTLYDWYNGVRDSEGITFSIQYTRADSSGNVALLSGDSRAEGRTIPSADEGESIRTHVLRDMFLDDWDWFVRETQRELSLILQSRTETQAGEPVHREIELTENNSSLRRAFELGRSSGRLQEADQDEETSVPTADIRAELHYIGDRCEYIVFTAVVPPLPQLDGRFHLGIVNEEEEIYNIEFVPSAQDRTRDQIFEGLFVLRATGRILQEEDIIIVDRQEHPRFVIFIPAMPAENEVEVPLEEMMRRSPNERIRRRLRGRWRPAFDTLLRELYERILIRRFPPNTQENRERVFRTIGIDLTGTDQPTFANWFCANQAALLGEMSRLTERRGATFNIPGNADWIELIRHKQAGTDASRARYFFEQSNRLQDDVNYWHVSYEGAGQGEAFCGFTRNPRFGNFRTVMRLPGPNTIGPPGIAVPICMQDPCQPRLQLPGTGLQRVTCYEAAQILEPPEDAQMSRHDRPCCAREGCNPSVRNQ